MHNNYKVLCASQGNKLPRETVMPTKKQFNHLTCYETGPQTIVILEVFCQSDFSCINSCPDVIFNTSDSHWVALIEEKIGKFMQVPKHKTWFILLFCTKSGYCGEEPHNNPIFPMCLYGMS